MTFMILKNHANVPVRTKKLSSLNKVRRVADRNKLVEKSAVPGRIKSGGKIDSGKDCPRARFGFVEPVHNELRKVMSLIVSKQSWERECSWNPERRVEETKFYTQLAL